MCMNGEIPVNPSSGGGNALLAVPKKGRLFKQSMKILDGAGLQHKRVSKCNSVRAIVRYRYYSNILYACI